MRDEFVVRGGGRRLRVRSVGADEGPLIVHHHGAPACSVDVDLVDDVSRRRGVRVASFDRPGWGGSDPSPFTFASIADDACAVADALGAHRFTSFGTSVGMAYGLACAAYRPDRVSAVIVSGGSLPFVPGTPRFDQLTPDEQLGVTLIGVDDAEAQRLLAEADRPYMDALSLPDDELVSFWRDTFAPSDQAFVDGAYGPVLLRSLREAYRQGQVGWARDNVVWMGAWPFELASISCPTWVWQGADDRPEVAEKVAAQIPAATLNIVQGRGHFVTFQEWDLVLDHLLNT